MVFIFGVEMKPYEMFSGTDHHFGGAINNADMKRDTGLCKILEHSLTFNNLYFKASYRPSGK